jgi:hypothetical protein
MVSARVIADGKRAGAGLVRVRGRGRVFRPFTRWNRAADPAPNRRSFALHHGFCPWARFSETSQHRKKAGSKGSFDDGSCAYDDLDPSEIRVIPRLFCVLAKSAGMSSWVRTFNTLRKAARASSRRLGSPSRLPREKTVFPRLFCARAQLPGSMRRVRSPCSNAR